MATNSLLGVDRAAQFAAGRDSDALGPSDTSDSGSDVQGELVYDDIDDAGNPVHHTRGNNAGDSDAAGTGERGSAPDGELVRDGSDILPDQVQSLAGDDALDAADIDDVTDLADLVADEPYTEEDGDDDAVDGQSEADADPAV